MPRSAASARQFGAADRASHHAINCARLGDERQAVMPGAVRSRSVQPARRLSSARRRSPRPRPVQPVAGLAHAVERRPRAAVLKLRLLDLVQQHAERREPIARSAAAASSSRRVSAGRVASCARRRWRAPASIARLGAGGVRPRSGGADSSEQADGIVRSHRAARVDDRLVFGQLPTDRRAASQVAGQVAAVDGGDVRRRSGRASGVVPVVEVPAVALHPQQCVERRLEPIERRPRVR